MKLEIIAPTAGLYHISEIREGKRNKRVAIVERVSTSIFGWRRGWRLTWKENGFVQFFRTLHDLGESIRFENEHTVYMDFLAKGRYGDGTRKRKIAK